MGTKLNSWRGVKRCLRQLVGGGASTRPAAPRGGRPNPDFQPCIQHQNHRAATFSQSYLSVFQRATSRTTTGAFSSNAVASNQPTEYLSHGLHQPKTATMSFVPVNPRPFLLELVNKDVIVRLKWNEAEYKGRLVVCCILLFCLLGKEEE